MHPRRNSSVTIAIEFIGEHGNTAAASLENTNFTNLATFATCNMWTSGNCDAKFRYLIIRKTLEYSTST